MNAPRLCDPDEVIALNATGLTQREIAERVGINQRSVGKVLSRHGVNAFREPGGVRKYMFNEEYFANVETPGQAYWLGFLAADGYVIGGNRGIGLSLGVRDWAHVELFRSALGADDVPIVRLAPSGYGGNGLQQLRLNSMRLARDARRYGIVPNKSTFCEPWHAPPELAAHYWRGAIDGDGHVGKQAKGYMSYCGTEAMCNGFIAFARSVCGTSARPLQVGRLWQVSVQGRRQVYVVLAALYANDEVALPRKKAAAMNFLATPYEPPTPPPCRIEDCGRTSVARKLCKMHWQRWRKHGDPLVEHRSLNGRLGRAA